MKLTKKVVDGKQVPGKRRDHLLTNANIAKKLQFALSTAFAELLPRYLSFPDKPNPAWPGAAASRVLVTQRIEQIERHMFELEHPDKFCVHKNIPPRSGNFATCPLQQAQITQVIKDKILSKLHLLIPDE
jgi:hypothetical protein